MTLKTIVIPPKPSVAYGNVGNRAIWSKNLAKHGGPHWHSSKAARDRMETPTGDRNDWDDPVTADTRTPDDLNIAKKNSDWSKRRMPAESLSERLFGISSEFLSSLTEAKSSRKGQKFVGKEIKHLMHGHAKKGPLKGKAVPHRQAIAIALNVARRKGLKVGKRK